MQRLQAAEKDSAVLRARDAKLQTALAEKNLENLELRWRLAAAREATNPSLAQVSKRFLCPIRACHLGHERCPLEKNPSGTLLSPASPSRMRSAQRCVLQTGAPSEISIETCTQQAWQPLWTMA